MLKPLLLSRLLEQGLDDPIPYVMFVIFICVWLRIYHLFHRIIKECGSILSFAGESQNEAITYATGASNIWQSYSPSAQIERLIVDGEVTPVPMNPNSLIL